MDRRTTARSDLPHEWLLWCGCRLPDPSLKAYPEGPRVAEEACVLCGRVVPPDAAANRLAREDLRRADPRFR